MASSESAPIQQANEVQGRLASDADCDRPPFLDQAAPEKSNSAKAPDHLRFGVASTIRASQRITSIDGLRGLLAAYVMLAHVFEWSTVRLPSLNPGIAVAVFFLMSGYVLTPTWKGDYGEFLVRRFVRLWPVYAFVLGVSVAVFGTRLTWADFAFYPIFPDPSVMYGDGPVWSLRVEAWMMLAFPLIVWSGETLARTIAVCLAMLLASTAVPAAIFGVLFVLGAYCARYPFSFRPLDGAILQWLGKISYSLYLTHWLVIRFCTQNLRDIAPLVEIPLALIIGYLVWSTIERRSIALSHMAGQFVKRARMAIA